MSPARAAAGRAGIALLAALVLVAEVVQLLHPAAAVVWSTGPVYTLHLECTYLTPECTYPIPECTYATPERVIPYT